MENDGIIQGLALLLFVVAAIVALAGVATSALGFFQLGFHIAFLGLGLMAFCFAVFIIGEIIDAKNKFNEKP